MIRIFLLVALIGSTSYLHGRISEVSKVINKVSEIENKLILLEEISTWNEKQIIDRQNEVNNFYYNKTVGGK